MNQGLYGWSVVIGGSFLIAIGGLVTTKGWNILSTYSQRKTLVQTLYQELAYNDVLISTNPYLSGVELSDNELNGILPLFSSQTSQNLFVSGLFPYKNKDDMLLSLIASFYNTTVLQLNTYIESMNDGLIKTWKSPDNRRKAFQNVTNSSLFKDFQKLQIRYIQLLKSKYKFLQSPEKPPFSEEELLKHCDKHFKFNDINKEPNETQKDKIN